MHKNQQIKTKRQVADRPQRRKQKKVQKFHYETSHANFQININAADGQKDDQKLKHNKEKYRPSKKVKYITEDIDCSAQEMTSIRSQSHRKSRIAKLSPHENAQENDVYEICRSSRKSKRSEHDKKENRDMKETQAKAALNLGNIKMRGVKSQSKDQKHLTLKGVGIRIKDKQKSVRRLMTQDDKKKQTKSKKKQFLSPQIVKQQNSYYFYNFDQDKSEPKINDQIDAKSNKQQIKSNGRVQKQTSEQQLIPPKRQKKYLFQSKGSIWKQSVPGKNILGSTVDLLN